MSNEYKAVEKLHKKASTAMVFTGIKEGNGVFKASHADMVAAHAQVTQDVSCKYLEWVGKNLFWYEDDGLDGDPVGWASNKLELYGLTDTDLFQEFIKTL